MFTNIQIMKIPERENRDNKKEYIIKAAAQKDFEKLKMWVFRLTGVPEYQTQWEKINCL